MLFLKSKHVPQVARLGQGVEALIQQLGADNDLRRADESICDRNQHAVDTAAEVLMLVWVFHHYPGAKKEARTHRLPSMFIRLITVRSPASFRSLMPDRSWY